MSRDVLILGASGYFGSRLLAAFGSERALGTYCHTPFRGGVTFNALCDDVSQVLRDEGPFRYAVLMFANPHIDDCARDKPLSTALNVDAPKRVVRALLEHDVVPVFISTDVVFDGKRGDYREDDPTAPILTYGQQKRAVEVFIETLDDAYIIARVSKYLGSNPTDGSMLASWLGQIERGETIYCATDQHLSLIEIDDAVEALVRLIYRNARGLFHVAGPRRWARDVLFRELVAAIAQYRQISPTMVPCSIREIPSFFEMRPLDTSLNCSKLIAEIGFRPRDIRETCRAIAAATYSK